MSKKNTHHNHKHDTRREEQERIALNRIFNTFLIGLAAECYLFIVYYVSELSVSYMVYFII